VCNTPSIGDHVRKLGWTRGVEVISNFTDTTARHADRPCLRQHAGMRTGRYDDGTLRPAQGFAPADQGRGGCPGVRIYGLPAMAKRWSNVRGWSSAEHGVMDRVRFLGWHKDTRPYVAAADIFVMPSSHEPLGNVILEAWAQKKPVVSSRSEGPSWFMRDGENGLLADIDDADGFSHAIERLINDRQLADRVALGGQETLMGQFSEEAVANAYIELFKRKP
jgi:glycosyltransferase involved in cell wall biosynthesis